MTPVPPSTPRIRRAEHRDASALAVVHVRSWQWAYRGLISDSYLDALSIERRTADHRQWLSPPTPYSTWVADLEGRILGFCTCGPSRDPNADTSTAEIGALYLERDAVGRGIGRQLLLHAIADLRRRGYTVVTLWVLDTNERARRFYEREGFHLDGTAKTEERGDVRLHEVRYRQSV